MGNKNGVHTSPKLNMNRDVDEACFKITFSMFSSSGSALVKPMSLVTAKRGKIGYKK